ncbi:uncharacterized protein LOC128712984 [Anopheles marshallii]|uniref:uncharacterized protein LOC128712984 n=1 Tax=Anopheles marshallii TaxID=1521116 RepID=UPI00237BC703|nr:uncharacterized protein LOC128712984 [Anopheles marshallii]
MGSLSYICWVVCLAQIATVYGRPDFATSYQFSATPSVSRFSSDISSLFASMDDGLHFTMSGAIPNSESQRQLLAVFAEDFGVNARAVTDQLQASAASTSSMGTTLSMVLSAYSNLVVYFNANANVFLSNSVRQLGSFVAREFFSGLVRLVTSLPRIRITVEALQNSLQNASTAADVPGDVLRSLVEALKLLKADLPLLVYSFQRIRVNLLTADAFMVPYNQDLQALSGDFMQEAVTFNLELSRFEAAVDTMFSSVEQTFNNTGTQLDTDLTGTVESQTNFMQLKTDLKAFASGRSLFVKNLKDAVMLASMGNRQSVLEKVSTMYYVSEVYPLEAPALELAMQLIASKVFDKSCYNRHVSLVTDLPTLGRIQLNECLNTELPRLQRLQELIVAYGALVSYDVEDLLPNLKPCRNELAASGCLVEIAAHYARLLAARDGNAATRAGNFFTSAVTASMNRINLCFTRVNVLTFQNVVPNLMRGMQSCGL